MHNLRPKHLPGICFALIILSALMLTQASLAQALPPADRLIHEIFQIIRSGSSEKLENLLQNGASANAVEDGYSALMTAALAGTAAQMEILINHGAAVNCTNPDGFTAIWFSVPDSGKTSLLLNHGADPRLRSNEGFTVLVKLANYPGTLSIFRMLLDHGADLLHNAPDNSLLYNAASSGDTAVLGMLLNSGVPVNDTILGGDFAINAALTFRSFSSLKMLVDHGAHVNVAPMHLSLDLINGMTPLMLAAVSSDSLSFFYLLSHGADPNARSKKGYSVLMFVQQGEKEERAMTQALLERGANPLEKTPDQTDALSLALLKGNTQTVALLKKYAKK
jgi:ankyrin repeat protein